MFYLIVAVLIASFYFFIAPKSVKKHHESSLCHGYLSIAPTFSSAINH